MPRFSADDPLLKILAGPLDKGPLTLLQSRSRPTTPARRRLSIVDGIPQPLPSSGEPVAERRAPPPPRGATDAPAPSQERDDRAGSPL